MSMEIGGDPMIADVWEDHVGITQGSNLASQLENNDINDRDEILGFGGPAAAGANRRVFNNEISHVQYLEDSPGRAVQPVQKRSFEDWQKHTGNLTLITPREHVPRESTLELMPGKRYAFYVNGINCVYENKTPYMQKVKLTVPAYSEPSSWNFLEDWKYKHEAAFVEITDKDNVIVAQAQHDHKGNFEVRGGFHADTISHEDRKLISLTMAWLPMRNYCDTDGKFSQTHMNRDSDYGFAARMAFEYNCILFGKEFYKSQIVKPGEDDSKFEPNYEFIHDMRSGPIPLGNPKTSEKALEKTGRMVKNPQPSPNLDFKNIGLSQLDTMSGSRQAELLAQHQYNQRASFVGPPAPAIIAGIA